MSHALDLARIAPALRRDWLFLVALAAIGCGDASVPKPLCDPSAVEATRVSLEVRAVGGLAPGAAVLFDNGGPYVFVDGQCNYWANNPSQIWDEMHSGVLDRDTAERLGARLHVDAWADLGGVWTDPRGGVFDAPVLIFDDSQQAVLCVDGCDGPEVPSEVKAMRDALIGVAQELWDRGAPSASSLRVIAMPAEPGPGIPFVDWPLARPISELVRPSDVGFGEGVLEADAASVDALKALRRSFLDGEHGAFVWDMLPVKADGAYYQLYVRDALPFEDANGLVPLTVPL